MMMTVSLSMGALVLMLISVVLFVAVWWFCHWQNMFESGSGMFDGLRVWMISAIFAMFWAVPSFAAWAIWATWFRG